MLEQAHETLASRGEVVVKFTSPPGYNANYFSSMISVDRVMGDTIIAYISERQFDRFLLMEIPFTVLEPPSLKFIKKGIKEKDAALLPEAYPSFNEYIGMMEDFAGDYSGICRLVEFGQSVNGRKLLALKITDNPDTREDEPVFLYTATIHGDEVVGYVLMLMLIEELLTSYESDLRIKNLIDNIEIWINPLANPDGTYFLSDESVFGATRNNANQIDLNRNFPDPESGDHPDGNEWQPETIAMMDLMQGLQLVLAANFHGGVEVVNYPWDTWSRLHADDSWYRNISRAYADTVHAYSPAGYMTFLEDGITNGYAWYTISGGRQDYSNFYLHAREVTIELSDDKVPDEDLLSDYWDYNRHSLLDYMEQVLFGISGRITDALTGNPLKAMVSISGYDKDGSQVFSSEINGQYYRLIDAGNYTLTFLSSGYQEKNLNVNIPYRDLIVLNAELTPLAQQYTIYPNPFNDHLFIYIPDDSGEMQIELFDISGRKILSGKQTVFSAGNQQIALKGLSEGVYMIRISYKGIVIEEKIVKTIY